LVCCSYRAIGMRFPFAIDAVASTIRLDYTVQSA
jgi:hypothetical protein